MWKIFRQVRLHNDDTCLLCRAPAREPGLCVDCLAELPRLTSACPRCALPLETAENGLCGECLSSPPPFDATFASFRYADPIDQLVTGLKYRGHLPAARLLAGLLAERVAERRVDLLIPIPLHPSRLQQRGFNQAAELCRVLAKRDGLAWSTSKLVRTHAGPSQRESNRRERVRNVRHAFEWAGDRPCPARVALVDDVLTTGATARAAAATLKQAGAEWVEVWAVARTPKG